MRTSRWPAALLLVSLVSACGSTGAGSGDPVSGPAEVSYTGPLVLERGTGSRPSAGAAGDAVDCRTWGAGYLVADGPYQDGATAPTAEKALVTARSERIFSGVQSGMKVAKQEADRVLYVVEVDRLVKQAVIVRNGPATQGAGGPGWYVESWARCDYSELPLADSDFPQLQLWTDTAGATVPTTRVQSFPGPAHCSWESMTFLDLGKNRYVRAPLPELADYFAEEFRDHAVVPGDARDTGYERAGRHLWISSDQRRAYVGSANDAESWPRSGEGLGCA